MGLAKGEMELHSTFRQLYSGLSSLFFWGLGVIGVLDFIELFRKSRLSLRKLPI
jgi:hypothetical protein